MRSKRNFFFGMLFGIFITAAIAMFFLPSIQSNGSFTRGFIACLFAFLFGHIAIFIWNPQGAFFRSKKVESDQFSVANRVSSFPRRFFAICILLLGLVSCFFLYRSNEWIKEFGLQQKQQAYRQEELIESMRKSGLGQVMADVLEKMDEEVNRSQTRTLSDVTITRIADLSYSFKPYAYSKGDSISTKLLSPERGQLLLVLSRLKIDSVSLDKIRAQVSFAGADLREADLSGMNLSGIDLSEADMMDANLEGANLSFTNLSFTNLWGAKLNKANLREVNLQRADLRWAELNEANLRAADLLYADLTSAQLRMADLRGAKLKWADIKGAFLNGADLSQTDLFRADFKRAQLEKVNLSESIMTYAVLSEANLSESIMIGTDLNNLIISEKEWLSLLDQWQVTGAKEIQKEYKIVEAYSFEGSKYQLNKIDQ
jgi:uncharacterized protein YjbI with pentapeptide repeats